MAWPHGNACSDDRLHGGDKEYLAHWAVRSGTNRCRSSRAITERNLVLLAVARPKHHLVEHEAGQYRYVSNQWRIQQSGE